MAEVDLGDDALHLVRQDAHDFSLNSFTLAIRLLPNGRFEAASESKVKNAEQIGLYALGFLCFSQKLSGKIFDLFVVRTAMKKRPSNRASRVESAP